MSYDYFVLVDSHGQAGLAATKRSVVESDAAHLPGARVIRVLAPHAYAARRAAMTLDAARRAAMALDAVRRAAGLAA